MDSVLSVTGTHAASGGKNVNKSGAAILVVGLVVGAAAGSAWLFNQPPASSPRNEEGASSAVEPAAQTDVLVAMKASTPPRGLAGEWKYESGKLVATCDGTVTEKDAAGSTFELEPGTQPGTFVYRKGRCALPLKSSGSVLSGAPQASCTEGSVTTTYTRMELNGTEAGAELTATGTMTSSLGSRRINCSFTSTGRARR